MLHVLDVPVSRGIDVAGKATFATVSAVAAYFAASSLLTTSSELVVDLFFKEINGFSGDVLQKAQELVSAEEAVEALVALAVVLCPAQNALTFGIHFLERSQVSKIVRPPDISDVILEGPSYFIGHEL